MGSSSALHLGLRWISPLLILSLTAAPPALAEIANQVEPLLTEHLVGDPPLDQYFPFVDPATGGARVFVSCGPTAVANLMRYWEHPRFGEGSRSVIDAEDRIWELDFAETELEYELATEGVGAGSPQTHIDATAMIFYAAAVAITDRWQSGSRTMLYSGLTNYLRFSPDAYIASRDDYSADDWETLIKSELSAGRPLIVEGWADYGDWGHDGHWFVCDGYNETGLYHIWWGSTLMDGARDQWLSDFYPYNQRVWIIAGLEPAPKSWIELGETQPDITLQAGQSFTIEWKSEGIDQVQIDYSTDLGTTWHTIAGCVEASVGQYVWSVPSAQSQGCLLRVLSENNSSILGISESPFGIFQDHVLQMESLEGWILQPGAAVPIEWDYNGYQTLSLDFSSDGGYTWQRLSADISPTQSRCNWMVPEIETDQAVLRLSESSGRTTQSTFFTIDATDYLMASKDASTETVALFHFDGDLVNHAPGGTLARGSGVIAYDDGIVKAGHALLCDNQSQTSCVVVERDANWTLSENWTVSSWIKVRSAGGETTAFPWVIFLSGEEFNQNPFQFTLNPVDKSIRAKILSNCGNSIYFGGECTYQEERWYHLSLIANGSDSTITFLIHRDDGALVGKDQKVVDPDDLDLSTSFSDLFFGGIEGGSNIQFDGWIDEFQIVQRVVDFESQPPERPSAAAPVITAHPEALVLPEGSDATLWVEASGTGPFVYQWYQDGSIISEATDSVLCITAETAISGRDFQVSVSNGDRTTVSSPITIRVFTDFDTWLAQFLNPQQLMDPLFADPDADPDGDRLVNLFEYVNGLDPLTVDQFRLEPLRSDGSSGILLFNQYALEGIAVEIEQSEDLVNWEPASISRSESPANGALATWEIEVDGLGNAARFLRISTHHEGD